MMRCNPVCRIQFPDHRVLGPVWRVKIPFGLARSLTARATACGWMRSLLRAGSACLSSISSHARRSRVTLSQKLLSVLAATRASQTPRGGTSRAGDTEHGRRAPPKHARPFVDLDDGPFAWQEVGVG